MADEAKKQEREEARALKIRQGRIRHLMQDATFRSFITDIVFDPAYGRLLASSFTGNAHTYFHEGARAMAHTILSEIEEAAPMSTVQLYQSYMEQLHQLKESDNG